MTLLPRRRLRAGSRRHEGGPHERERGAILVISSLVIVALVAMAAIVVDLGMARDTRREAQSDADMAALAAGWFLAGNGSTAFAQNPEGGCVAALNSVRTNINDWPAGASLPCAPLPSSTDACTSTSPANVVTSTGSDPYVLTVKWPVPSTEIARAQFTSSAGSFDGSPCERMLVEIRRQNPAFFAGVLGSGGQEVVARAVVRVDPQFGAQGVPALLFLERERCGSLEVSSGGSNPAGIQVMASGTQQGYIHIDSSAQVGTGLCTTNNNAGGYSAFGTALPSSGGPSIRADGIPASGSQAAVPGRIGVYSLYPDVNGRGGAVFQPGCTWVNSSTNSGCGTSGLSSEAVGAGIQSRTPVDNKYFNRISTLYSAARAAAYGTAGNPGYTIITGGACNNLSGTYPATGTGNYWLNCNASVNNGSSVTFNGSVVINGSLDVAGTMTVNGTTATVGGTVSISGTVHMPNVRSVAIRGCAPNVNNCSSLAVNSNGSLIVNGSTANTTCVTDRPFGNPAVNHSTLTVFGGPFDVGSNARIKLCQTTVFLSYGGSGNANATPPTDFARVMVPSGPPNCTTAKPCPASTTAQLPSGFGGLPPLLTLSNAGSLNWTAPNQSSGGPSDASPTEDLALWTEAIGTSSSQRCSMSGQSNSLVAGVFFHPNCDFFYTGQSENSNELNAQFVGRRMNVSGQGILKLRPNPDDSILVPLAGTPRLIR